MKSGKGSFRWKRTREGLTISIVPKTSPGLTFDDSWSEAIGLRGTVSWTARLDNVFIPWANVMGEPGDFVQKDPYTYECSHAAHLVGTTQGIVDRYVRQQLEVSAGEDNEGVRLALYFQREAPRVTSAYGLLADQALWQVVKTVFGFPDGMAAEDIEKQAAAVEHRLDIGSLQDPEALDRLLTRFTAAWDASDNAVPDPVMSLFTSTSPTLDNVPNPRCEADVLSAGTPSNVKSPVSISATGDPPAIRIAATYPPVTSPAALSDAKRSRYVPPAVSA